MKKMLSGALSLAVAAPMALSSTAGAQSSDNVSTALDMASYSLLVKLPIRPGSRAEFLRIIKDRVEASRQRSEVVDYSDAYQKVAQHRFLGAQYNATLVEGIDTH